jgi:hypothetical protein
VPQSIEATRLAFEILLSYDCFWDRDFDSMARNRDAGRRIDSGVSDVRSRKMTIFLMMASILPHTRGAEANELLLVASVSHVWG